MSGPLSSRTLRIRSLTAAASVDSPSRCFSGLEPLEYSRRAYRNDFPVLDDLRRMTDRVLPAFETQHGNSLMVTYVQWLSSFVFKVASTRFELKIDFSSLDVCICPESLVEHVRTTMLSLSRQGTYAKRWVPPAIAGISRNVHQ